MTNAIIELLFQVGNLALCEGEKWRLEHARLMDAYEAASGELKTSCGLDRETKG